MLAFVTSRDDDLLVRVSSSSLRSAFDHRTRSLSHVWQKGFSPAASCCRDHTVGTEQELDCLRYYQHS